VHAAAGVASRQAGETDPQPQARRDHGTRADSAYPDTDQRLRTATRRAVDGEQWGGAERRRRCIFADGRVRFDDRGSLRMRDGARERDDQRERPQ
jgi:hypothetical protein